MKKKVLILGAGEMQIPIIKKSKEMGIYTLVVDMDSDAPGLPFADEYKIIDTTNKDNVYQYAKDKNIDGILTTSDYPVNIVAYVSQRLGLLGSLSEDVAKLCTNKYQTRKFLQRNNFNVPKYEIINNIEQLDNISFFPCIIKPTDSSASRGVKKVRDKEELFSEYENSIFYSRSGEVIVEEYIEGKEYSAETLTQNSITHIIAITEKLTIGEENGTFVEDTHIEPARISDTKENEIKKTVIKLLTAMQFDNCPSHTEFKVNENGIYIIEVACRLGGDYITSDLVPLSMGVDMLANLIHLSLNEPIVISDKHNKYSIIQFINQNNYDRCLNYIEHHEQEIHRYEVKKRHNNEIKSSLDRMGYLILTKDNQDQIEILLRKLK